jgi:hypothetical protein
LATGYVLLDAQYSAETGELTQKITDCPICGGSGEVSVYLCGRLS